jgi:acyl dehydratase
MTSFHPYTLNTLVFQQMFLVDKCLDAILWVVEMKLYKMLVTIKLVLYGTTRSHKLNWNMKNHPGKQCNHGPHGSGLAN